MSISDTPLRSAPDGPLRGLRVLEVAAPGASALCAMQLADFGAQVLRIEHGAVNPDPLCCPPEFDVVQRHRASVTLDLASPAGAQAMRSLLVQADALIEAQGPGGMETWGLGPQDCLAMNPRLVYARMSGWGQHGPLAGAPGMDINHVALTGALHAVGRAGQPSTLPLSLIADYAGGSMYLGLGLVAALIEARQSGRGQVVDAALVDAVALLMTTYISLHQAGSVSLERGTNLLDTGSPFYDCYACADGRYVAFGGLESKFYQELLAGLGLDDPTLQDQGRENWPRIKAALAAVFLTRPRDAWAELLGQSDACLSPVLDFTEALDHPQIRARGTWVRVDGVVHPGVHPKFSRTPGTPPQAPHPCVPREALAGWLEASDIDALVDAGTIT